MVALLLGACGQAPAPRSDVHAPGVPGAATPAPRSAATAGDAEPAASDVDWEGTLQRCIGADPGSLNPLFQGSMVDFQVLGLVYDFLFTHDRLMQFGVNDALVAGLEEAPDGLSWTVTLRPEARWQDGTAMTAEDVCFSYGAIVDERVPCPAIKADTERLSGCDVLDGSRVRLRFAQRSPTNKWGAAFPVVPAHVYGKDRQANPDLRSGAYYESLERNPVGNGPYRLASWEPGQRLVLERWDDYPGKRPAFRRIVLRVVPDSASRYMSFLKGDLDEVPLTTSQFQSDDAAFAARGTKLAAPTWGFLYIAWKQDGSNPFFGDARVRRAMGLACNVDGMIERLGKGLYQRCLGIWHPDSWMFDPSVKALPFDLEAAGALLDEAGWIADPSDEGWRHRRVDGRDVRFAFTLDIPPTSETARSVAALFQEDLRSIGVKMEAREIDKASAASKVSFDAMLTGLGVAADPDSAWSLWRCDQQDPDLVSGRNSSGYCNPRVDELFELGRAEMDPAKRRLHYQEMHRTMVEDAAFTFLWHTPALWGFDKGIRGVTTGPRGPFAFHPAERAWWRQATHQLEAP